MNLTDIQIEILEKMNWDNAEQNQNEGFRLAKKQKDLTFLLQPIDYVYSWENCAKVLSSLNDTEMEKYIPKMLEWIRDLNWIGAEIILDRLLEYPALKLAPYLNSAALKAKSNNDKIWINFLSILLRNDHISDLLSFEVLDILAN